MTAFPRAWIVAIAVALDPGCAEPRNDPSEKPATASTDAGAGDGGAAPASRDGARGPDAETPEPPRGQPPTIMCGAGRELCGFSCVDASTDRRNCGRCGVVCPQGTTCAAGVCGTTCAAPMVTCGTACVDPTSTSHCGRCDNACDANATCQADPATGNRCVCREGYAGNGNSCAVRNECSDGSHRCGGLSGSCGGGAGPGYSCTCANGFQSSGGMYPQCYKAGRYTLGGDHVTGTYAYHFMTGAKKTYNNFQDGDFYVIDSDGFSNFWANNCGMRGLQRVESSAPLVEVPIPEAGYNIGDTAVLQGGTYVSRARAPDTKYYVVFRVTSASRDGVTFDWALVYRPIDLPPEPRQPGCNI
jgi:hypothetical protein